MLVAEGGCGKSTLMFALVRHGWNYLSDDVNLLCPRGCDVQALPLRRDLSLHITAARRYPEINDCRDSISMTPDSKLRLNLLTLYPNQLAAACLPQLLLFPRILRGPTSRLEPMPKPEALWHLIKQSALLFVEPTMAPRHVDLLRRLVGQCKNYSLAAGTDLEKDPGAISGLVDGIT